MKIILAQIAIPRFKWELEVLLANIRQFTDLEVVLLFSENNFTVPAYFDEFERCSVFVYKDDRHNKDYIPSIKPYLFYKYLSENKDREQETYFYLDSDIIFREWIDFATLPINKNTVVGSDCDSYLGYNYVSKCQNGETIFEEMSKICEAPISQMKKTKGIGAHVIVSNPKASFWEKVYLDSISIHKYFETIDSNIQKWTAEMWAQLWGWVREGFNIIPSQELNFCLPTDPIEKFEDVKILHNAGILPEQSFEYFYKGKYLEYSPYNSDFSNIRKDKATYKYVEAILKVVSLKRNKGIKI